MNNDCRHMFQEVTNVQDEQIAIATLASLDWNLQKAIEAQISSDTNEATPMDSDGVSSYSNVLRTVRTNTSTAKLAIGCSLSSFVQFRQLLCFIE